MAMNPDDIISSIEDSIYNEKNSLKLHDVAEEVLRRAEKLDDRSRLDLISAAHNRGWDINRFIEEQQPTLTAPTQRDIEMRAKENAQELERAIALDKLTAEKLKPISDQLYKQIPLAEKIKMHLGLKADANKMSGALTSYARIVEPHRQSYDNRAKDNSLDSADIKGSAVPLRVTLNNELLAMHAGKWPDNRPPHTLTVEQEADQRVSIILSKVKEKMPNLDLSTMHANMNTNQAERSTAKELNNESSMRSQKHEIVVVIGDKEQKVDNLKSGIDSFFKASIENPAQRVELVDKTAHKVLAVREPAHAPVFFDQPTKTMADMKLKENPDMAKDLAKQVKEENYIDQLKKSNLLNHAKSEFHQVIDFYKLLGAGVALNAGKVLLNESKIAKDMAVNGNKSDGHSWGM